ncbi:MAG: type II secretion system secretin GspD [Deltaproteobacteria bacterium]|nr:type II secretion system secretin GspD [Deltaproteobacteria bacterium]
MKKDIRVYASLIVWIFITPLLAQTPGQKTAPKSQAQEIPNPAKETPAKEAWPERSSETKQTIIQADPNAAKLAPKITSINFRDESLDALAKTISKLTGKSFMVTTPLANKKITIISQEEVTIEEAYRAFLSALDMNNLTVVPVGKFLKIVDNREAAKMSVHTYANEPAPTSDGYITQIYHLKYISAGEIARSLQLISNPRAIVPYEPTNSLIISDTGANINRLIEILQHLDIKGFEEKLEVIKIRHASAKDVAQQLNDILSDSRSSGGYRPGGTSRFSPPSAPSFGGGEGGSEQISKIIPDNRTNHIIVKANKQGIEKLKDLISRLDIPVRGGGKIHVYYLQNSSAEKIVTTLNKIVGTPGRAQPGVPAGPIDFEGDIKISDDKETNSIVVTASLQDFNTLKDVIQKLDIPRKQVFVEAYILEVSVAKTKALGLSYTAGVPAAGFQNGLVGGFSGTSPNSLESIIDPTKLLTPGSGVIGFITKKSIEVKFPDGQTRDIPAATALIRALATDANSNLLSAPQILALDNEESQIEVSEKIPTLAGTTITSTGLSQQNIQREPIGLTLKIKPQINETSKLVRLEIDQVIEDISNRKPPSDIQGQTFASTKRAMKSTVLVRDQDTVVIGGLLKDNVNETSSKVPLLGDIPIIGWLFKSSSSETIKTNLLLLLTPTIVQKYGDFRKLFDAKLKDRQEFIDENYTEEDKKTTYLNRLNPPKLEE